LLQLIVFCYQEMFRHPLLTFLDGVQMRRAYVHELQHAVLREMSGPSGISSRFCDEKLSFLAKQLAKRGAQFPVVEVNSRNYPKVFESCYTIVMKCRYNRGLDGGSRIARIPLS